MPVSQQSQAGGESQAYKALSDSIFSMVRVSMPGIIQTFDPIACTCTVQPAISGQRICRRFRQRQHSIPSG